MREAARTARAMWTLFEPVHAVTYFAPQARAEYEQGGLRGFWRGYFAGRAAPLGPVDAAPVTAAFCSFAPAMVRRAIPGIWDLTSPAQALVLRQAGAVAALRSLLGGLEPQVTAAADLLGRAAEQADCTGRVLAAANAALLLRDLQPLDEPQALDDALGRLWLAATVLREHRGDGHIAALVTAELDGCTALVLRCGLDLRREDLQPVRGWTDEQWDAAQARMAARGWTGPDGRLTSDGAAAHQAVEDATDRAAGQPWAALGTANVTELATALTPLALACAAVVPYPSPIGVPAPAARAGSAPKS